MAALTTVKPACGGGDPRPASAVLLLRMLEVAPPFSAARGGGAKAEDALGALADEDEDEDEDKDEEGGERLLSAEPGDGIRVDEAALAEEAVVEAGLARGWNACSTEDEGR